MSDERYKQLDQLGTIIWGPWDENWLRKESFKLESMQETIAK